MDQIIVVTPQKLIANVVGRRFRAELVVQRPDHGAAGDVSVVEERVQIRKQSVPDCQGLSRHVRHHRPLSRILILSQGEKMLNPFRTRSELRANVKKKPNFFYNLLKDKLIFYVSALNGFILRWINETNPKNVIGIVSVA